MADDNNQRNFRADDAGSRTSSSGNDPLAELARLIGQNDPFAEYGRNSGGRPADPNSGWPDTATYPAQQALPEPDQAYANAGYGRQSYGSPPLSTEAPGLYEVDAQVPAFAPGYATRGYEQDGYAGQQAAYDNAFPPSQEPMHDVHQQFGQAQFSPAPSDDYYDDVAPKSRRVSVLAIAGVIGLAVIGTAGALGYRAVFGPSSAPTTPPVIRADATPSKVVPAATSREPGKSTDRVGANGQIEQLLSRQEQPVPVATTPNQPTTNSAFPPAGANAPAMGSGVVGEARKVRTVVIRPDQPVEPAPSVAMDIPAPTSSPTPVRVVNTGPAQVPAAAPAQRPAPQAAAPAPVQQAPAPSPQPQQVAAPSRSSATQSNAPLSLNPNAAPATPAPRVASAPPTAAAPAVASGGGGYAVQVSSQRSEGEAQTAFQSLQGKFPNQLGGRQAAIRRADLGEKGTYYRAVVPVSSSSEANELCASLKAAGGSCIIQRN